MGYLVGERMQAKKGLGLARSASRMGRQKAPVLPDPVCASPMMSRPARSSGGSSRGWDEAHSRARQGLACLAWSCGWGGHSLSSPPESALPWHTHSLDLLRRTEGALSPTPCTCGADGPLNPET